MGIKHVAVKATGDKGYASEWNDNHTIDDDVDFDQNEALNLIIEQRTDFPAGPIEGQLIWRSDLNILYIWDGAAWAVYTPAFPVGQTLYWSCAGVHFDVYTPSTQLVRKYGTGEIVNLALGGVDFNAAVFIPNGATITAAIVYSDDPAPPDWFLFRITINGGGAGLMGQAAVNVEDNTIANPIVDNTTYAYYLIVAGVANTRKIYGARVTYTL